MRAIGAAISALAEDGPFPSLPEGFHRGRYHRLRAGSYRIMYVVDDDVITVERGAGRPPHGVGQGRP